MISLRIKSVNSDDDVMEGSFVTRDLTPVFLYFICRSADAGLSISCFDRVPQRKSDLDLIVNCFYLIVILSSFDRHRIAVTA
jgi:hypothetical protein